MLLLTRHASSRCFLQDPRGQATACCKLGVLYQQQGQLQQAVGYFERFFELARSLGEPLPRTTACLYVRNSSWADR